MKIETKRLILRKFSLDDLDAFAALMAEPEVMRFSLNGPLSKKQAQEYLQKRILDHYNQYGYGFYAVIHKQDNCLIGCVGLLHQKIDDESKTELAFRLYPQYWGQGLATEAATAVYRFAYEELRIPELISIIDPLNTRSLSLAKRIGMHFWKETVFHSIPVQIYKLTQSNSISAAHIRNLKEEEIEKIARYYTFPWASFDETLKLWNKWFKEQLEGIRTVCLLENHNGVMGYGSLLRTSECPFFVEKEIPEINAIWIDEPCRKLGLATQLIDHIEKMARAEGYQIIGLGVGLYRDYGPAQKLYAKLGYHPDGNGITYKGKNVEPGAQYPVDDELLLWLTKNL